VEQVISYDYISPVLKYTPTQLKQMVLATMKPLFYGKGAYAGKVVLVEGEVSNIPSLYGQAIYFNLKDAAGCNLNIRAFRAAFTFDFAHAKGTKVLVTGTLELQEKPNNNADFDLRFVATKIEQLGLGETAKAERSLIQELDDLSYFSHKTPLPSLTDLLSCRIGVVTSGATGANAFEDIQQTLAQISFFELELFPASLYSSDNIAKAITLADKAGKDILIVTRGGGDRLDVFSERPILDAVFKCQTPIISAVGHAKDHTLIDRVADISTGTPTEAAKVLSDEYLNIVTRKDNQRLQKENIQLQKTFMQIREDYAKQSQTFDQLSKTVDAMRQEQHNKDETLKSLADSLAKSRKTNRYLLGGLAGVIIIAALILKLM
jgi:exodeoxyribonuclease VII large subunit